MGNPDEPKISTSYAERANLSIRMNQRRFTRLTDGFSKKVENHTHSFRCGSCTTTSAARIRH
jgi:IS1 family transposase